MESNQSNSLKDITCIEDIQVLVNTFYGSVRADEIIGSIFEDRIQNRWPEHLEKMYRFWQTILLDEHTYTGAPFVPHATMPIDAIHFERWVGIWHKTVDELYTGKNAAEAKWRGAKMASIFLSKIQYLDEMNMRNIY